MSGQSPIRIFGSADFPKKKAAAPTAAAFFPFDAKPADAFLGGGTRVRTAFGGPRRTFPHRR